MNELEMERSELEQELDEAQQELTEEISEAEDTAEEAAEEAAEAAEDAVEDAEEVSVSEIEELEEIEAEEYTEPVAVNRGSQKKPRLSYERKKGLYGYGFIALWIIGTLYFFIYPLIVSFIYSLHDTKVTDGGMELNNRGFQNYVNAFRQDQDYSKALVETLSSTALKTPLILVFSIFIAVILNQKFRGRTFARAVFFLPVIIATGPVIDIINGNMSTGGYAGGSEQFSTMFETNLVDQLLNFLGIYRNHKLADIRYLQSGVELGYPDPAVPLGAAGNTLLGQGGCPDGGRHGLGIFLEDHYPLHKPADTYEPCLYHR